MSSKDLFKKMVLDKKMKEMKEMSKEELQEEVKKLQEEAEKWKSKFRSQVSKMSAYKTKVQQEIRDREFRVKWKEEEIERKENFFENTNIEKFYLIVNTLDKELPADPERIKDATIIKIKEKYNKEFDVEIIAAKNIARYLLECDVEILDKINLHFDIYNAEHNFTIEDINDFIDDYVGYLVEQNNNNSLGTDYSRIKIEKKIEINKLDDLKSHILDKMDAVDNINKYLTMINSEGWSIDNYNKAKNYVISKYLELSKSLKGTELYNTLLDELLCNDNLIGSKAKILESIVIDIFIKCDIFEKEC